MPLAVQAPVLDAVGRRGTVRYEFSRQGPRTVLVRSFCSSPWHYVPPSYLDDTGCLYTWLVNPSGGLVGGDQLKVEAQLQADTHVVMTSPSANRVYRSMEERALQEVRLAVGPGARLEWLPEVTIPFAGSRFIQSIHIDLAPGSSLVVWDAMASGRVAMGERWAFTEYANELIIRTSAGSSVIERFSVTPDSAGALATRWDYVGSLFVVCDGLGQDQLRELACSLNVLCEAQPGELAGGVSEPAVPGFVVKVVARSAPVLTTFLESAWRQIRFSLWQLPAPILRRY